MRIERNRWPSRLAAAVLLVACSSGRATGADVRALVVGVGTGGPQAILGARKLADRFRAMGFAVEHLEDPKKAQLEGGIDRLVAPVPGTRLVIFAFGGHGLQHQEVNYLVPAGGTVASLADIATQLVPLSRFFDGLRSQPGVAKLVMLDACRSIPSDRWLASAGKAPQGLADVQGVAPPNSFVSFATRPGSLAGDGSGPYSPYTTGVLAALPARGRPLGAIFERTRADVLRDTDFAQVPWDFSSLTGEVSLLPAVSVQAQFDSCDDVAFVFNNGVFVAACPESGGPRTFTLKEGSNEITVGVYNQHTFQGGNPLWGPPEGWSFSLHLTHDGHTVADLATSEDPPGRNGPHHGHYFTASRLVLHVDPDTGAITIERTEPELWRSQ